MNKTIFIAAMLAVATVLAAGLTVLPSSVQEAQANPCADEVEIDNDGNTGAITLGTDASSDDRECNINGNDIDFEED